ncbi:hypothetical protein HK405_005142 [Cladochytrium tenue]|nr:hypothetical protein HK405_005142 [Cladochytrium tenue]
MQAPMQPQATTAEQRLHPISTSALAHNHHQINYARSMLAGLAGGAAGILGLQGFSGFVFFAVASAALSGLLALRAGSDPTKYFTGGAGITGAWSTVLLGEVYGSLFSYVLFWTLAYGLVHVYD